MEAARFGWIYESRNMHIHKPIPIHIRISHPPLPDIPLPARLACRAPPSFMWMPTQLQQGPCDPQGNPIKPSSLTTKTCLRAPAGRDIS